MANLVEYVKTVWENGKTALNAARMNNMEQGISNCATEINKLGDSVCQRISAVYCDNGSASFDISTLVQPGVYLIVSKGSTNDNSDYHLGLIVYAKNKVTVKDIVTTGASIAADGTTITVSNSSWYMSYYLVRLA